MESRRPIIYIPVNWLSYWVKWKKYICCFMRATHVINNIYKLFFELIWIHSCSSLIDTMATAMTTSWCVVFGNTTLMWNVMPLTDACRLQSIHRESRCRASRPKTWHSPHVFLSPAARASVSPVVNDNALTTCSWRNLSGHVKSDDFNNPVNEQTVVPTATEDSDLHFIGHTAKVRKLRAFYTTSIFIL